MINVNINYKALAPDVLSLSSSSRHSAARGRARLVSEANKARLRLKRTRGGVILHACAESEYIY